VGEEGGEGGFRLRCSLVSTVLCIWISYSIVVVGGLL